MKLIKFVFWLIIICLLITLVIQNQEYFLATTTLHLDLKAVESWNWTIPELQTGIYLAICFALGFLLTGYKALAIKFRLNRNIRSKDKEISRLKDEVNTLRTELEVFKSDPYIKKGLKESETVETPDELAEKQDDTDTASPENA